MSDRRRARNQSQNSPAVKCLFSHFWISGFRVSRRLFVEGFGLWVPLVETQEGLFGRGKTGDLPNRSVDYPSLLSPNIEIRPRVDLKILSQSLRLYFYERNPKPYELQRYFHYCSKRKCYLDSSWRILWNHRSSESVLVAHINQVPDVVSEVSLEFDLLELLKEDLESCVHLDVLVCFILSLPESLPNI